MASTHNALCCVEVGEWMIHTQILIHTMGSALNVAVHTAVTDVLTGHKGLCYSLSCRHDARTKEVLRGKERPEHEVQCCFDYFKHTPIIICFFALNSNNLVIRDIFSSATLEPDA